MHQTNLKSFPRLAAVLVVPQLAHGEQSSSRDPGGLKGLCRILVCGLGIAGGYSGSLLGVPTSSLRFLR